MRARLLAACCLLFTVALWGCGGGGGNSNGGSGSVGQNVNVNVAINWGARSRALDAPSSALSAVITLKNASPTGGDFAFTLNRDAAPAAYLKSYTSPNQAKVGTWDLQARFYAQPGGSGSVVGTSDATINLGTDGNGIGSFVTTGTVATVAVVPGQTVGFGQTQDLLFTAKDANGANLVLTPGASTFQVTGGGSNLQIDSTQHAKGVAKGIATVTVTVDGKTSDPVDVAVDYISSISVTPTTASLYINGQTTLTAKVTGLPETAVNWSIQEGTAGGDFGGAGPNGISYNAPSVPGTYHVAAISQFDATIRTTATITVTVPTSITPAGMYVVDAGLNNRLVKVDNITGTGWLAMTGKLFGFSNGLRLPPDTGTVYVASDGRIYSVDPENNRITRMDDITGKNKVTYGSAGSGIGQFSRPSDIFVTSDGHIYITDQYNHRLVRLNDMNGTGWTELNNVFGNPRALFVTPNGHIYVLDGYVVRVDDMKGTNLTRLSPYGTPTGLFVTPSEKIYLTQYNTITQYDDISGTNPTVFGGNISGGNKGQLSTVTSVAVDQAGHIYIADTGNGRIVRIDDMNGAGWTTFGTPGSETGQFISPVRVFVY